MKTTIFIKVLGGVEAPHRPTLRAPRGAERGSDVCSCRQRVPLGVPGSYTKHVLKGILDETLL